MTFEQLEKVDVQEIRDLLGESDEIAAEEALDG